MGPHERELNSRGITPDADGVRNYLRLLTPTEAQRREAAAMVGKLGHQSYSVRETATRQLLAIPHPPVEVLKKAAAGNDPEVRWRAGNILRVHAARATPTLHAVLAVIAEKKLTGLTAEVLSAIPQLERPFGTRLGRRALRATATKDDLELLKKSTGSAQVEIRAAAVSALAAVAEPGAFDALRPFLSDKEPSDVVRLAAARAFASAGKREAVAALVRLLESDDVTLRTQSSITLYAFTGKRFGFAAYDDPANRAKSVKKWREWLSGSGKTAELHHPLKIPYGESYLNGHLLLAYGYRNKVAEFDAAGKEIWTYEAKGAYSAEKLPNGNILIGCYAQKEVLEVTPEKKVVWRMTVPASLNARPLANGNILIACHTSKEVWEVSRDKKVVWKYKHDSNCYDAHRLPNGNTMISSDKGIIEVTPAGKTVWEYTDIGRSYGVQPLANGNILVAAYSKGEVIEITRMKKVVWTHKISSPFDVYRLPNGNTLITSSSGFNEVDRDGKTLWTKSGNSYGRARK